MSTKIPSFKVANLSTCHLPQQDAEWLVKTANYPVVSSYFDGFYLVIPPTIRDIKELAKQTPLTTHTINLLKLLHHQKFDYANFDSAGAVIEGLQSFNW